MSSVHRFTLLLSAVALICSVTAVTAVATCGGGEEEKVSWSVEIGEKTLKVGSETLISLKNTNDGWFWVDEDTVSDKTILEKKGESCAGWMSPTTGFCNKRKIKCLKVGEATWKQEATPGLKASFVVKCHA